MYHNNYMNFEMYKIVIIIFNQKSNTRYYDKLRKL